MCNLITSYAYVYKDKSKCFKWQHLKFGVFFMNKVFTVTWEKCITTVGYTETTDVGGSLYP